MAGTKCLKSAIETKLKLWQALGGFQTNLAKVRIISAKEGYVEAAMKVEQEHCNSEGKLHGGMSALLVDNISTLALRTYNLESTSVSVDMSISYLAAAKLGSEITMTAHTLKRGRNLAFLTLDMHDKSTGKLLVSGKHTKFIVS